MSAASGCSFLSKPPVSSPSSRHFIPSPIIHFTIKSKTEIRVCVNRTCNRQGSREILEVLSNVAPADISVNSCGCLGKCGAGPNLVLLPEAILVGHCGTSARAAEVLRELCLSRSISFDPARNLEALALRKKGEVELEKGSFSEADALFSLAIDLKPSGGLHVIYKSRSAARLAMGGSSSALEDAKEASRIDPKYPQAYICQGDAFLAMEEYSAAEKAFSTALEVDPSIRCSKSFKARIAKLQEKFTTISVSS